METAPDISVKQNTETGIPDFAKIRHAQFAPAEDPVAIGLGTRREQQRDTTPL